jgi:hypothetical protein
MELSRRNNEKFPIGRGNSDFCDGLHDIGLAAAVQFFQKLED